MSDKELRFGIHNERNGLSAATWKLWTPKSKHDIYLTCRQLGGDIKLSFHESGSWHFGFSKEGFDKLFDTEKSLGKSRHMDIWEKPIPILDGVTLALRIVTPFSAVTTPIQTIDKRIVHIPNCSEGFATEIDILITSSTEDLDSWPGKNKMGTKLVGSYSIGRTEQVWVVYWEIPLPNLSSPNSSSVQFFKGKNKSDLLESHNLKAVAFADAEDGSKILIDCAVVKKSS